MKKASELELLLSDFREAFCRIIEWSRRHEMMKVTGWSLMHTKLDIWMVRACNTLRSRARELDEAIEVAEQRAASLHCTRGKSFCMHHQGMCALHYNHCPDERCTCKPCLPAKD